MSNNRTVTRNIYFYDLFPVLDTDTNVNNEKEALLKTFSHIKQIHEDFLKAKAMNDNDEANRLLYQVHFLTKKGDYLYILVDSIVDDIIKFRIVRCRTNAFPYIEIDGKLEKITEKINGDFDVAEVTHCVIFADKNILGAEYNSAGARATSLSILIDERNYEIKSLKILNKINNNALKKLSNNKKYKLFNLTIKNSPEIIDKLINKGLLPAIINDYEFDTYTITIKRKITKLKDGFIPPIGIEEIQSLLEENGDQISKLVVDQGLYTAPINLLSDKIVETRTFEYDENERILNSDKVYNSIINLGSVIR